MRVCLFLPHDEPVRALYILMVLYAFVFVYMICSAKVSFSSSCSFNLRSALKIKAITEFTIYKMASPIQK